MKRSAVFSVFCLYVKVNKKLKKCIKTVIKSNSKEILKSKSKKMK